MNSTKLTLEEKIRLSETSRLRQKVAGFKKFAKEILQGWFPSKDTAKFPEGVHKERVVDKGCDEYYEKVVDASINEIVREVRGRLIDHR